MPAENKNAQLLTQLDDVAREFLPLQRLVVVHVDLSEQLDQVLHDTYSVPSLRQMDEHDSSKLFHG